MRTRDNYKITDNFSFYEIIEGRIPAMAALNWENIAQYNERAFLNICTRAETVRAIINFEFVSDIDSSRDIGLRVTSGWRCLAWEQRQGRKGTSKHTDNKGDVAALDLQPTNCSKEKAVEIIQFLDDMYSPRTGPHVWQGGWAIKKPTMRSGKVESVGFFHIDNRPVNARWSY